MVLDMTIELAPHFLRFGPVDGEPANGAVSANRRFRQFHQAPCARGDNIVGLGLAVP